MKRSSLLPGLLLLAGCSATRVSSPTPDAALLLSVVDQRLVLSSLNSAAQTRITRQELRGDTLVIAYEQGAFVKKANTVPLGEPVRYVRCGNRLYRVVAADSGPHLEQL
ncbi:hypothetical protein [Hymenobacter sp. B81]|uniref:hypothetical protein n=1 Tax=Hymenobacter sp. B81 TaxID=3344878 RepID=UPI0037DCA064